MREMVAPFYWAAGALAGCGLIGLMTIGWPFLLAGAVLALVGLILLRTKGIYLDALCRVRWAAGLVFLLHISNGVRTA